MGWPRISFQSWVGLGALALGLGAGFTACFIEPAQPSTFRFQCSADSDCEDGRVCTDDLCQQPCGGEDDDACAAEEPVCLNGYCSSICPTDEDPCPAPQSCVSLDAPGEEPSGSGVCTVACEDDSGCPEGNICFAELGLCVATCADSDECGSGEECVAGFCVPSGSGGGFP